MDLEGMDLSEGIPSMDQMQQQQEAKAAYEEQKANILDQILEPGTKDRIKRLAIVNPDMATRIQDSLIQAATSGQLRNKVSEETLIEMIDNFNDTKKKVTIHRRKYEDEDSDNDDDLL